MRLGILGGTFDPIHKGHILMAKTALSALGLDKVLFIPAGDPYFKSGLRNVSLAVHRLNMTKLAIEGEPAFEASDMEIAREGQTYTSDTLKELSEKYPGDELFFILGADTLVQFSTWHEPEKICDLASLAVFGRRDQTGDERLSSEIDSLRERFGARIRLVDWDGFETSSTEIRERAARDEAEDEVPAAVLEYIRGIGLYRPHPSLDQMKARLRRELKPSRFIHSLGVADTACDMACIYGEDPDRAYLAGLLHDVGKPYGGALGHAAAGAAIAEKYYGIEDKEILSAIAHHTVGSPDMGLLEEIVYVADMIEPGREGIPDLERLRELAYSDIKKAVFACAESTLSHLKEKGKSIDEATLSVYNKYREYC